MAMNATKIAQELEALEAKNKACAEQLRELYRRYLAELSHAASQQLMTVCYHLCTESYPEAFLGVSPQQRQMLQEKVRDQGEKLRQQLSLEGLLLTEPGDGEEANQPRIAVIKAEITGDDLEIITSALDDDSDRILALLKDKDINLPFDLEAVMKQQQLKAADEASDVDDRNDIADSKETNQIPSEDADIEPWKQDSDNEAAEPVKEGEVEAGNATDNIDSIVDAETTLEASSPPVISSVEGYSSTGAAHSESSSAAGDSGRSLGRRFLEDILSGRALDRRLGNEDAASMSGEGSLQVASHQAPESAIEKEDDEEVSTTTVNQQDAIEPESFDDNNGFDPNFEPPPAEDRYEPTPLKSSDKLDISPGVLASALAAEGEDDKGGMLMRPTPYDGTTELSEEALRDPFALIRWVERMERGISQRLRQSSQRMTRTLEKSRILNNELPDGLLEAAVRPDGDHEDDSDSNMPHVLSLRLNAAGKDNHSRKDRSIRIVAIYLRLSEIEFATPGVMAWRNQLRSQVKRLRQLSNEYRECKHAQSVVKAQELWRHGWGQD